MHTLKLCEHLSPFYELVFLNSVNINKYGALNTTFQNLKFYSAQSFVNTIPNAIKKHAYIHGFLSTSGNFCIHL